MSIWEFFAMVSGSIDDAGSLSAAEADDLWNWMKTKDGD